MANLNLLFTETVPDVALLERGEVRLLLTEEDILQMLDEKFTDKLRATLRRMRASNPSRAA